MENINQINCESTSFKTSECIHTDKLEQEEKILATNLCIACVKIRRAVAFVPCAHYITCLSCGHGMNKCPVCQTRIMACLRIYE